MNLMNKEMQRWGECILCCWRELEEGSKYIINQLVKKGMQ